MVVGNVLIEDGTSIKLKNKLTEWGLLDPRIGDDENPSKVLPHTPIWNEYVQEAAAVISKLHGDTSTCPLNSEEANRIINYGSPPPIFGEDRKTKLIAKAYRDRGWYFARGTKQFNVLFIEDFTRDWMAIGGRLDAWDDVGIVFNVEHSGKLNIVEEFYQVTTEPGRHYTSKPMNLNGAARIKLDAQYKAWTRGVHGSRASAHQAFIQSRPIAVHRDLNKDGSRVGDKVFTGLFGCNIHSTTNSPTEIGLWGAGCTVFRIMSEFMKFRRMMELDRRYQLSHGYTFICSYIGGDSLIGS